MVVIHFCGGPKIAQFKVHAQICNYLLDCRQRCQCEGHIIDEDRQDDADITSDEDIHSCVRISLFETHRLKSSAHLAIPVISALFGAIERFLQQAD